MYPSLPPEALAVHDALIRARIGAEGHMRMADRAGFTWGEETITEILLAHAHPEITSVTFTKRQERHLGADWLWWWIDDSDEAFGMLVQAKRLHAGGQIDFAYRGGEQMDALRASARLLSVPDSYVLYLGSREFRTSVPIDGVKHYRALHRHNSGVSYVPGWVVQSLTTHPGPKVDESRAVACSAPLESMVFDNAWRPSMAPPAQLRSHDPVLYDFLTARQRGVRRIARNVLDLVAARRVELFRQAGWADEVALPDECIFNRVLADPGHDDEPYMEAVLKGLRSEAPDYVQRALEGEPLDLLADTPNIEGMVVVGLGTRSRNRRLT